MCGRGSSVRICYIAIVHHSQTHRSGFLSPSRRPRDALCRARSSASLPPRASLHCQAPCPPGLASTPQYSTAAPYPPGTIEWRGSLHYEERTKTSRILAVPSSAATSDARTFCGQSASTLSLTALTRVESGNVFGPMSMPSTRRNRTLAAAMSEGSLSPQPQPRIHALWPHANRLALNGLSGGFSAYSRERASLCPETYEIWQCVAERPILSLVPLGHERLSSQRRRTQPALRSRPSGKGQKRALHVRPTCHFRRLRLRAAAGVVVFGARPPSPSFSRSQVKRTQQTQLELLIAQRLSRNGAVMCCLRLLSDYDGYDVSGLPILPYPRCCSSI